MYLELNLHLVLELDLDLRLHSRVRVWLSGHEDVSSLPGRRVGLWLYLYDTCVCVCMCPPCPFLLLLPILLLSLDPSLFLYFLFPFHFFFQFNQALSQHNSTHHSSAQLDSTQPTLTLALLSSLLHSISALVALSLIQRAKPAVQFDQSRARDLDRRQGFEWICSLYII